MIHDVGQESFWHVHVYDSLKYDLKKLL